jgi:hypothetical protein
MKQKKKVSTVWSSELAYIIGIIATDGNLSIDGRHIVITSKDEELLLKIKTSLFLTCMIGERNSNTGKMYYVLQIGDKNFYTFLLELGISPAKSKTIQKVKIPKKYFFHFLRGCIDGDGNIDIFYHRESNHPQLRIRLASASKAFLEWIHSEIKKESTIQGGWIYSQKEKSWHVLTYGKKDSIILLKKSYENSTIFLERKYKQAKLFI